MTRLRFGTACALVLAGAALASAQPGKPPGVIQFKQFGATPEQFWQSSITRWTSQLALDLEAIKADVARANLNAVARAAVNVKVENAILQTAELDQLVRRGGAQKEKAFAAFADVERALTGLNVVMNQNPAARQAAAASLARADTAYHQLASALGTGDNDPARLKRRLIRLSEALDDNTEELRTLINDLAAHDRALDRALALYAREPRLLSRRVRDDADADLIKRSYEAMVARWSDATTILGRARQLPQAVQAQAQKVDGLHRRLGSVLNLPPYPNGANPPPLFPPPGKQLAFAVGADNNSHVRVYADDRGTVAYNFLAYDKTFTGGVRVDMADLNGDGVPDLIVAPGPARVPVTLPVRVYDGRDLNLLVEFVPFAGWKGGLYAVGVDLMRDGRAAIAVNAEGSQHVKVFDLAQGKEIDSFFAHDQKVTGGVRIAWGDVNGDGTPDLITVNGPGNAVTTVKVFNGKNRDILAEFPAVDNKYRGGGFVAAADLTGDGRANPVVGLDAGTIPLVRVYDGKGKVLAEWLAYDEKFRGGARVAVTANNNVLIGPGPGLKNSPLRLFNTGRLKNPPVEIVPFPGYEGGISVGGR